MLHSFSLFYIRAKTEEPVRLTGDEISCVKNVEDSSSDWWQKSRKVLRGWSGSETFPVLDLIRSACYLSQCFSISSGKLIKLLDGACQPFLPQNVFLSKLIKCIDFFRWRLAFKPQSVSEDTAKDIYQIITGPR